MKKYLPLVIVLAASAIYAVLIERYFPGLL